MYVKDSVIEAQIEKDLKKEHVKGRIQEVENQIRLHDRCRSRYSGMRERLKRLREELKLLSD